jgi:glycosyltransferase involved in cell wall biosynthesis
MSFPAMNNIQVVHAFTYFHALGGVPSMLRRNWEGDSRHGVSSQFLAFFEPDDRRTERVHGLGLTWHSTVRLARQRFRQRLPFGADLVTYSNVWGLPLFADLDRASRRIGILHGPWPDQTKHLRTVRGLLDGVIAISSQQMELAARLLPELAAERIASLPNPAGRDRFETTQPPLQGRPLIVGYCGRVQREQKRVERLPKLLDVLNQAGVNYRFEVLGGGPGLAGLRRQFAGNPNVVLRDRLQGEAYWQRLRNWDALVFVSDYEGVPISLIEGLSVGVIPVFPRIGSGVDGYVMRVKPDLLYPPGDLTAVARALQLLARSSEADLAALRQRCGEIVQPHLGECDLTAMSAFVRRIRDLPQISCASFPPRPFYGSDHCPFGLLRRLWPAGFWRGNLVSTNR